MRNFYPNLFFNKLKSGDSKTNNLNITQGCVTQVCVTQPCVFAQKSTIFVRIKFLNLTKTTVNYQTD